MENDILIQEYEKKLADIQSNFDTYKKEMEANILALKEENKAEIEKINARYREELRQVISARSTIKKPDPDKSDDPDETDDADDSDENMYDSRFSKAIKKLKSKYKMGD